MRSLGRVLALLLFGLSLAPPIPVLAAADPLAQLEGRWHCTVTGRHDAERYYLLRATDGGTRTLYGREDTIEPDGAPSVSFERIVQRTNGSSSIESNELSADGAPNLTTPLRFASDASSALTYTIAGDTMERVATSAGATIDSERCARVHEPPFETSCAKPNVPATTLRTEDAPYPRQAAATKASGTVLVVILLDDHSRLLWAEIGRSDNHLFDEPAIRSARLSTFRTEVRDCRPISARFIFSVDFNTP